MKRKKRIGMLVCILLLVGCTRLEYSYEEMENMMLEYMENKYHQEFILVGGLGTNYQFSSTFVGGFDSVDNPEYKDISVYLSTDSNKKVTLRDNFSSTLIDPICNPYTSEKIIEAFEGTRYYISGAGCYMKDVDYFDFDADIYEHMKTDVSELEFTIHFLEGEEEKQIEERMIAMANSIQNDAPKNIDFIIYVDVLSEEVFLHNEQILKQYRDTGDTAPLKDMWYGEQIRTYTMKEDMKIDFYELKKQGGE